MAAKKSTIYDHARLADTSASTVSAILNGTWQERRVSSDTAERVFKLAEQLKYMLNRQASGLRDGFSDAIKASFGTLKSEQIKPVGLRGRLGRGGGRRAVRAPLRPAAGCSSIRRSRSKASCVSRRPCRTTSSTNARSAATTGTRSQRS